MRPRLELSYLYACRIRYMRHHWQTRKWNAKHSVLMLLCQLTTKVPHSCLLWASFWTVPQVWWRVLSSPSTVYHHVLIFGSPRFHPNLVSSEGLYRRCCLALITCPIQKERHRWPEKLLISRRSGTHYIAMVTKLLRCVVEHIYYSLTAKNQTCLIQIGWDIFFHHL